MDKKSTDFLKNENDNDLSSSEVNNSAENLAELTEEMQQDTGDAGKEKILGETSTGHSRRFTEAQTASPDANSMEEEDEDDSNVRPYVPRHYKHSIVSPLFRRAKRSGSTEDEESEETKDVEYAEEFEEAEQGEESEENEGSVRDEEYSDFSDNSFLTVVDEYGMMIEEAEDNFSDDDRPNIFECTDNEDVQKEESSSTSGDESGRSSGPSTETVRRSTEIVKRSHEESENPLVRSLKKARVSNNKSCNKREYTVTLEHTPTDLSFCGNRNLLAASTSRGDIILKHGLVRLKDHTIHTEKCVFVEFCKDNRSLISCGDDNTLAVSDAETGRYLNYINNAHGSHYVTALALISRNTFATADSYGAIKLWDRRRKNWAYSWRPIINENINFMITDDSETNLTLLTTNGNVACYNIRNKKKVSQTDESQPYKADFTCGNFFMNDTRFAVGTNYGTILTYNSMEFENWTNEIPSGYRKKRVAINCMIPVTERIGLYGMDDGFIRAISVFPSGQFGIVGNHGKSIEALDISQDGTFIASAADEKTVRIWDVKYFSSMECFNECKGPSFNERMMQLHLPSSDGYSNSDFYKEMGAF